MKQIDKAGENYWNKNWTDSEKPLLFNEKDKSLNNYVNFKFHKFFESFFHKKRFSIIEIGCANSIWPIYFKKNFNAISDGLDYSKIGCKKSRALFKYHKIDGKIYCADLFNPPKTIFKKYDFVVTFGVIEHFVETKGCLEACAKLLKPGGSLITIIPNMNGINGFLQKMIDRKVYDVHVPLSKKDLTKAHENSSLLLKKCDYFLSVNLSVINSGTFSSSRYNKYLRHLLSSISKTFWSLEKLKIKIPCNFVSSPYLISVAEKT